jgi:hypothetical protein
VASGRVHDGNAAALDGVAGHAGLFATAADLAIYAQTLLAGGVGPNGVRVFADSTVRAFLRRGAARRAARSAGRRAAPTATTRAASCSTSAPVMHTGFTGTFLVIDPVRQAFACCSPTACTRRAPCARARHPRRARRRVGRARPRGDRRARRCAADARGVPRRPQRRRVARRPAGAGALGRRW